MRHFNTIIMIVFVLALLGFMWTVATERAHAPKPVACTMDARICPDGSAVGRVGPSCEFAPCPSATPSTQTGVADTETSILVEAPLQYATITSPITITGKARGNWFFEASFPITIVDWDGRIIGEGHAEAQSDWMTSEFVPFSASIDFVVATDTPYRRGSIILHKDNPSGLPENDASFEIPVNF